MSDASGEGAAIVNESMGRPSSLPAPVAPVKRGPGRPKQPVSRETLVAHARAAFGETGYAGTSMDTIARRAGLKKSSLFHHFSTKDELYLAVFADIMAELGKFIEDARLQQGSFSERLDTLSDLMTDYLGGHPEVAAVVMRELIDAGPFLRGVGKNIVEGVLTLVENLLRDGMAKSEIPENDTRQIALSIAGLHMGFFAAPTATSILLGESPFSTDQVQRRRLAVRAQVRQLCGLLPR